MLLLEVIVSRDLEDGIDKGGYPYRFIGHHIKQGTFVYTKCLKKKVIDHIEIEKLSDGSEVFVEFERNQLIVTGI